MSNGDLEIKCLKIYIKDIEKENIEYRHINNKIQKQLSITLNFLIIVGFLLLLSSLHGLGII
jgi:uncharacterized membrane protein